MTGEVAIIILCAASFLFGFFWGWWGKAFHDAANMQHPVCEPLQLSENNESLEDMTIVPSVSIEAFNKKNKLFHGNTKINYRN